MNYMMDNMPYHSILIMCTLMFIGLFLLVIFVGATAYIIARLLMKKSRIEDRPLMILRERYVKGEIIEEEFREKRKFLNE